MFLLVLAYSLCDEHAAFKDIKKHIIIGINLVAQLLDDAQGRGAEELEPLADVLERCAGSI